MFSSLASASISAGAPRGTSRKKYNYESHDHGILVRFLLA